VSVKSAIANAAETVAEIPMTFAQIVGRFPLPPGPKASPKSLPQLREDVARLESELDQQRALGAFGGDEYLRLDRELTAARIGIAYRERRLAEIDKYSASIAENQKLIQGYEAEGRDLEKQLKVLERRDLRHSPDAYRLTNRMQELIYFHKCATEAIEGADRYDRFGIRSIGWKAEREKLIDEAKAAGDI
jgi:hypothetical protein